MSNSLYPDWPKTLCTCGHPASEHDESELVVGRACRCRHSNCTCVVFVDAAKKEADRLWNERYEAAQAGLRPKLTPEFLATLVQAVRTVGWMVDYHESRSFVSCCFEIAGLKHPVELDAEPFAEGEDAT